MRRTFFSIAMTIATASAYSVNAAELSGTIDSQITLVDGCAIFGAPAGPVTGANFGMLQFGARASAFTGSVTAQVTGGAGGSGTTQIICSPDVAGLTISVDGGQNAGQGSTVGVGTRAMAFSGSYLPYEVYRDLGMTTAYPIGTAQSIATPSSGPVPLPIYGRVNKTATGALQAGTYTDRLVVTLTW